MEFRVGSTGVGAFAGCGVGLGIISPIRLEGIPVIGQVVASVRSAFFQLDSSMLGGNLQRSTRHISSSVSSKLGTGMSAGAGCGILLGYGYGAGLYLKSDVTHDLMRRIIDTRKRVHDMLGHHHPQLFKSSDTAHSSVDHTSISTAVNSNVSSSSGITPVIDQTTQYVPDVSLKELKLQVSELNKAMIKQRNKVDSLEAELKEMKEELGERRRSL
jgi:hypothetical protein